MLNTFLLNFCEVKFFLQFGGEVRFYCSLCYTLQCPEQSEFCMGVFSHISFQFAQIPIGHYITRQNSHTVTIIWTLQVSAYIHLYNLPSCYKAVTDSIFFSIRNMFWVRRSGPDLSAILCKLGKSSCLILIWIDPAFVKFLKKLAFISKPKLYQFCSPGHSKRLGFWSCVYSKLFLQCILYVCVLIICEQRISLMIFAFLLLSFRTGLWP